MRSIVKMFNENRVKMVGETGAVKLSRMVAGKLGGVGSRSTRSGVVQ